MVFLVQSTTDEELIEECFQIIQSICSSIKSLILKMEELAKIDEEFGELIEMYSSIETIYCDLADIFFKKQLKTPRAKGRKRALETGVPFVPAN